MTPPDGFDTSSVTPKRLGSEPEPIYYTQLKKDVNYRGSPEWGHVDRAQFCRSEESGFCGATVEEICQQISNSEDVPVSCVGRHSHQTVISISCKDLRDLPAIMVYCKKTGLTIPFTCYTNAKMAQDSLKGMTVDTIEYTHFTIDKKWVVRGTVVYSPEMALDLIVKHKEDVAARERQRLEYLKEIAARRRGKKTISRSSRIPVYRLLYHLWHDLKVMLSTVPPFSTKLYTMSYRAYDTATKVIEPKGRQGFIASIPKIARLYFALSRKKDYRSSQWREHIKTLHAKHMKDPMMTEDFRRFIIMEHKR